jgi:galactose-1-phosphate uridylyltransferase
MAAADAKHSQRVAQLELIEERLKLQYSEVYYYYYYSIINN